MVNPVNPVNPLKGFFPEEDAWKTFRHSFNQYWVLCFGRKACCHAFYTKWDHQAKLQIQPWKLQDNLLSQILRHGTRIGQGSCSSHHSKKIQLQPAPNHPNHHNHQARLWSNTNTTLYQLLTTCYQCSRIMDFQPEEISSTGSTAGNHGSVCPEAFFVLVDWQENPGESGATSRKLLHQEYSTCQFRTTFHHGNWFSTWIHRWQIVPHRKGLFIASLQMSKIGGV